MRAMLASLFKVRTAGFLAMTLLVAGCGTPLKPVMDLSKVKKSETVLVGRVELDPPLAEGEQSIDGITVGKMKNRVFLLVDPEYRVFKKAAEAGDIKTYIEEDFGKTFYVRIPNKIQYINLIQFYLAIGSGGADIAYLPAGVKIDIKPGDKAVYMGTLRYKRNEFFDIEKSMIVDDHKRATKEFQKKFGTRMKLTKRLAVPVKDGK